MSSKYRVERIVRLKKIAGTSYGLQPAWSLQEKGMLFGWNEITSGFDEKRIRNLYKHLTGESNV